MNPFSVYREYVSEKLDQISESSSASAHELSKTAEKSDSKEDHRKAFLAHQRAADRFRQSYHVAAKKGDKESKAFHSKKYDLHHKAAEHHRLKSY
jgi:thymidine phosphorylase